MVKFKQEFKDAVDVDKVTAFCFGVKDDITPENIAFAGGGSKFSALCGFKFISKVNPTYNHGEFRLIFCAKLRSKIYRQAEQNPSQWFAIIQIRNRHIEVLDKAACKTAFDFDVDKFFNSDLFLKYAPMFKNTVAKGIKKAMDVISNTDPKQEIIGTSDTVANLPRYIKAIQESLPLLQSGKFNDRTYTLTMNFEDPNKKTVKKPFHAERFADFLRKNKEETEKRKSK